jgi:ribonuclease HI
MPKRSLDVTLATALAWEDREDTAWMDGSRQDNSDVGCSVVWRHPIGDGRGGAAFHLGHNKEVFDAELYMIYEAISILASWVTGGHRYTVFADTQSAIWRCASNAVGMGHYLARLIIAKTHDIIENRNTITIRWVPGHKGIPGNEEADRMAKLGALNRTAGSPQPVLWPMSPAEPSSNAGLPKTRAEKPPIGGLQA